MSVNNTISKQSFNGDGSTEIWPVTDFKVFAATEIRCIIKNPTAGTIAGLAAGASVELTYTTDFTVALADASDLPTAPTVTIINATYDDLAIGLKLIVLRNLPETQLVDLKDNVGTPAATFEQVFDRVIMLIQQLQEILNRVPSLDFFSTASAPTMEDPETGKALIWDSGGDLVNSDNDFDTVIAAAAASASSASTSASAAASSASAASSSASASAASAAASAASAVIAAGAAAVVFTSQTTTYAVASGIGAVLCDATSAGFSVTLPAAASNSGRMIRVKKTDSGSNVVTVARAGSDTIDGATSLTLNNQYEAVTLISDGTNWYQFA